MSLYWKKLFKLSSWEDFSKAWKTLQSLVDKLDQGKRITKTDVSSFENLKHILSWIGHGNNHLPDKVLDDYFYAQQSLKAMQGSKGSTIPELSSLYSYIQDNFIEPSPTSFRWNNLRIILPEGSIPSTIVKRSLDNLSEAFALLHKRGFFEVVYTTLKEIQIIPNLTGNRDNSSGGVYWVGKEIMGLNTVLDGNERLLTEVFLHELGHHIHMYSVSKDAKEFWDSGWSLYDSEVSQLTKDLTITKEDVIKWFQGLDPEYDLASYGKSLKGVEKAKFIALFYESDFFKTPKSLTLTYWGQSAKDIPLIPKSLFPFLSKWQGSYSDLETSLQNEFGITEEKLIDAAFAYAKLAYTSRSTYSSVLEEKRQEILRANQKELSKILQDLGIPSQYGHTNVMEDFAETFKSYVLNPDSISDTAKWRLLRTLGISESSGKPLKKSANLVSSLIRLGKKHPDIQPFLKEIISNLLQ